MRNFFSVLLCLVGWSALLLFLVEDVYAMPEYTKMYKIACTVCHTNVPALNEFGIAFLRDNPTPPEMKGLRKKAKKRFSVKEEKDQTTDSAVNNSDVSESSGTERNHESTDDVKGDKKQEVTPEKVEPEPPLIIHRWVGKDGSAVFTDNPLRKPAEIEDRKRTTVRNKPTRSIVGNDRIQRARSRGVHAKEEMRNQLPVTVAKPRVNYRSFSECMENVLVARVAPATAQEAMDIFVEAERRCAPFAALGR